MPCRRLLRAVGRSGWRSCHRAPIRLRPLLSALSPAGTRPSCWRRSESSRLWQDCGPCVPCAGGLLKIPLESADSLRFKHGMTPDSLLNDDRRRTIERLGGAAALTTGARQTRAFSWGRKVPSPMVLLRLVLAYCLGARERIVQMQLIDPPHDGNLDRRYGPWLVVQCAAPQPQQLRLPHSGRSWLRSIITLRSAGRPCRAHRSKSLSPT
jgi:hypothetical protein